MKQALNALCLALASLCGLVRAEGEEIVCPAAILGATTVAAAEGWEPVGGAAEYKLEHAQLYAGHPSEEAPLTPEEHARGKDLIAQWRLKGGEAQQFWVGCAYRDTTVVLARKLDARLSQCVARYAQSGSLPPGQLQSLTCT